MQHTTKSRIERQKKAIVNEFNSRHFNDFDELYDFVEFSRIKLRYWKYVKPISSDSKIGELNPIMMDTGLYRSLVESFSEETTLRQVAELSEEKLGKFGARNQAHIHNMLAEASLDFQI